MAEDGTFVMPAADVEINAVFTPGLYTVRYEIEEVDNKSYVDNTKYKSGDIVSLFKNKPEKAGYTFVGWLDKDNQFIDVEKEFVMPGKDVVLKAVWNKIDYTVGFEDDDKIIYEEVSMLGDTVTLPKAPTRKNAIFLGWEIDGIRYPESGEYNVVNNEKVKFVAKWEVERYKITYHLNDGKENETAIFEKGEANNLRLLATRDGYEFKGWYKDEDLTIKVESLSPEEQKDMSLYAKWQKVIEPSRDPSNSVAGTGTNITKNDQTIKQSKDKEQEITQLKEKEQEIKESKDGLEKSDTTNGSKDKETNTEDKSQGALRYVGFMTWTLLYLGVYVLIWKRKKEVK